MKLEEAIKQPVFKNERQKALINIMYTGNYINSRVSGLLKPYGISSQQLNVLRILRGAYPQPMRALSIQERMLDRMSNVSRIIEKLRLKGLIERRECPKDRRAVDVIITEQGMQLLKELDQLEGDWQEICAQLSDQELQTLNHILDKIRAE